MHDISSDDRCAPPLWLVTPLLFSYDLSLSWGSISVTFASTLQRFRTATFAFGDGAFHFWYACLLAVVCPWFVLLSCAHLFLVSFYFLLDFYWTRTFLFYFKPSFDFSLASFYKEFSPAVIQLSFYPSWLFPLFYPSSSSSAFLRPQHSRRDLRFLGQFPSRSVRHLCPGGERGRGQRLFG